MFKTSRLLLRAYKEDDKGSLIHLINNSQTQDGLSNDYLAPKSPKYMDDFIPKLTERAFFAVIEPLDNPRTFAGFVTVEMRNARNRNGDFGIALLPEFQGKGLGSEAARFLLDHSFRYMGFHRVSLVVYESNTTAFEMYKKIGFIEEGRVREARFRDGKWEDNIYMGILASEWFSKNTAD